MPPLHVITGSGAYAFHPLSPHQIDLAYPLVRDQFGALSMDRWRTYAERLTGNPPHIEPLRGISVAERPKRYLRGLFAYHVLPDLEHGDRLVIDCIAVPDALDRAAVSEALLVAIGELAEALRCGGVTAQLGAHNRWLGPAFESAGYTGQTSYGFGQLDRGY